MIIMSASNNELTNLGRCRLRFKLGEETFEYYFQIIKNLKRDLILGLNFQKTFKISQDITDSNNLYLHIRNKIITFSTQSTNKKNYICTQECVQIKPKNWKQFRVNAPRNLKSGELYEIDFNGNGFPEGIIPLTCTFIAGAHQKFIHVNLINQGDETAWIPRGQHIGIIMTSEGREPSQEEAHEILHQFQNSKHQVNEMKAGSIDDFITNGDQVQQKRPVEHKTSAKVSPEMKKKLAQLIEDYADVFSKNQYDVGESTHPPIEIPTEGLPCISAPYTIPLKFRPWVDNTLNKLLEAGMIQCTMSMWASPVIIVPKKGLQTKQGNPGEPLPIDAKLRMCCDYCKLNSKLPADFWNHDKKGR